jgi:DNA polymerase-1
VKNFHVPRVWRRAKPARRRFAPLIRPQGECQTRVLHRDCEKSSGSEPEPLQIPAPSTPQIHPTASKGNPPMLLIIDGYNIICRSFYGIKMFSNSNGLPLNAITGFFGKYLKLIKDYKPTHVAVAMDLPDDTYRDKLFAQYKGTRQGMPHELIVQEPYIREILGALGVAVLSKPGYEADDIMGIMSRQFESAGEQTLLVTGDRDMFQLITGNVSVLYAKNGGDVLYTEDTIWEKYGVKPAQLVDVKALMGDASDNIPGVAGIGEKTALRLIQQYGSIAAIYDHLADITPSAAKKLIAGKADCEMSLQLGRIITEADIGFTMEDCLPGKRDESALSELMKTLETPTLARHLGADTDESRYGQLYGLL